MNLFPYQPSNNMFNLMTLINKTISFRSCQAMYLPINFQVNCSKILIFLACTRWLCSYGNPGLDIEENCRLESNSGDNSGLLILQA